MSTRFVHTSGKRPPVDVEWQSAKDPWAWRRFVDFMWQEGYVIYEEKKRTVVRLKGETFYRQQVEDMLKEAGVEVVGDVEERVEQLEREMEAIRGNRQA